MEIFFFLEERCVETKMPATYLRFAATRRYNLREKQEMEEMFFSSGSLNLIVYEEIKS